VIAWVVRPDDRFEPTALATSSPDFVHSAARSTRDADRRVVIFTDQLEGLRAAYF
jgi:hypothetical protein